jgi:large subunit ribosomal protein L28e
MSADLVWLLVRNNSSFIVKRDGANLTTEAGNLTNQNRRKYTGLASEKIVDVAGDKDGFVHLTVKNNNLRHRSLGATLLLKKDPRRVNKAIKANVAASRKDLVNEALYKATRLKQTAGGVSKKTKKQK